MVPKKTAEYKQETRRRAYHFPNLGLDPLMMFRPSVHDCCVCVFVGQRNFLASQGCSHFCLGSSFIGLGNYHPSFAARSWGLRCFLLAMQWAPHSQVPMAMPQMAAYPQMAATETAHGVGPTGAQCAPEL